MIDFMIKARLYFLDLNPMRGFHRVTKPPRLGKEDGAGHERVRFPRFLSSFCVGIKKQRFVILHVVRREDGRIGLHNFLQ